MRFAAIADIHGNHLALQAVLADIDRQGITDIVNLGDCFSGPLEAGLTGDLLLARDIPTVRGNHDRYLTESAPEAMHFWEQIAYAQLSAAHVEWLRTLPFSMVYRDLVYLCHATPQNDNHYWLETVSPDGIVHLRPLEEIEAYAAGIETSLILCGHSHIPRSVRLSDGRLIVNPGSVGCPGYDDDLPYFHKLETGTPAASYAVLEQMEKGWLVTFRQVPYDHAVMAKLAADGGRPEWASALSSGWIR